MEGSTYDGWFLIHHSNTVGTLTVNYSTGGSATFGTDYTVLGSGSVTFQNGVSDVQLSVRAVQDTLVEGTETVMLTLSGGPSASINLYDDDGGPLVAVNDSFTVVHDRHLSGSVVSNDTNPNGAPLTVIVVTAPAHGAVDGYQSGDLSIGGGNLYYNPETLYVGADSFTYKLTDGVRESNVATVSISVTNSAPVAVADLYSILEDQVLRVVAPESSGGTGGGPTPTSPPPSGTATLLTNDTDGDADILSPELVTDVSNGTLVFKGDGGFIYTPTPNFYGTDTFTYKITDGVATSAPVTVTIAVARNMSPDIDGRDPTTHTAWMSEPDEQQYGLGVAGGQILLREPPLPSGSGWSLVTRRVFWDSNVFIVGGVMTPGYIDLAPTGDVVKSVVARASGFVSRVINYHVVWHNSNTQINQSSITPLQVVEKKAVLDKIEFTSDHNILLKEEVNVLISKLGRYDPVEFVRMPSYNAPMSQNRDTNIVAKVSWGTAGVAVGTEYRLIGESTETGFKFDSGLKTATGGAEVLTVTATNKLGKAIHTVDASITWTMVLSPGVAADKLSMGDSGKHTIFVTYGTPRGGDQGLLKPTLIRMKIAIDNVALAYDKGMTHALTLNPTPARIVFETLQLHQFNLNVCIVKKSPVAAWQVPEFWTKPFDTNIDPAPGSDCISGAVFTCLATTMAGIPGFIQPRQIASTVAKPKVAVEFTVPVTRLDDNSEILGYIDRKGRHNFFEAIVSYTSDAAQNPKTFYFPSGAGYRMYDKLDDVLSIFASFEWCHWVNKKIVPIGGEINQVEKWALRAPNVMID